MAARAAFFRVEGTLITRPTPLSIGWLAANAQDLGSRIARLSALGLSLPFWGADVGLARRLSWSSLRGMTEDRLHVLGEELYETWIRDAVQGVGRDLLSKARAENDRLVLVSDNLDVVMSHLARELGADDLICNRMELRNQKSTGRLQDPVVGSLSGTELRKYAAEHELDLGLCCGYGAASEDAVLLSAVGLPCAVAPDRTLRRLANTHSWPVVNA